jgi:hypothetical protein
MGVDSAEMRAVIAGFDRDGELADTGLHRDAVQQSFDELLNGVGMSEDECRDLLGIDESQLNALFESWLESRP